MQLEEEVLAAEIVAAAQDVFDDFRHRLVLVEAVLLAAREQGQTRLQGDFVAGFVDGAGQAFEAGDHAVQGAQRFDFGGRQARNGGLRGGACRLKRASLLSSWSAAMSCSVQVNSMR